MNIRQKFKQSASKETLENGLQAALNEYDKAQARLAGIESALSAAGLYAMEHADGTFSIQKK